MLGTQLSQISQQVWEPITKMSVPQFLSYIQPDLYARAQTGERWCIVCYESDRCKSLTRALKKLVGKNMNDARTVINKWVFDNKKEIETHEFIVKPYTDYSDCYALTW